jgi:hypothetical protein
MAVPPVDSTPGLDVARSTTDGVTWVQAASDVRGAFLGGHHPLGFFWESTWPWGPPDDVEGSTAITVSEDGETWTELLREHAPILEAPGGLVITRFEEDGLESEIVVYNEESLSTVQANWPSSDWPGFLGATGNKLILIDGADIWVGELFED